MKRNNRYVQVAVTGALFLMAVVALNNLMEVGERLGRIHPSMEMIFYAVSAGLILYLVVVPVARMASIPKTRISDFVTEPAVSDAAEIDKFARDLLGSRHLSDVDRERLRVALSENETEAVIRAIYIEKAGEIEREIEDTATLVLLATAVSQNGLLDALSVIYYNMRMIRRIVAIAGFRPSMRRIGIMIRDIFVTAFVFNTVEEINPEEMLEEILDASGEKLFGKLISKISSSFIQGCFSAYVTLKIGYVAKYWLYMSETDFQSKNIKKMSRTEARKVLVARVLKNGVGLVPKQAVDLAGKMFSGKGKKTEEAGQAVDEQ